MFRTPTPTAALTSIALAVSVFAIGCEGEAESQGPAPLTAAEADHLAKFDDLDFNVFTGQRWDEVSHSHSDDVIVHWPDGRTTVGIDTHIADLQSMFVYAPDTRIVEHPIRIAAGEWTAVSGVLEGTFSEPMPLADGSQIEPTGKAFVVPMATLARWADGTMQEEWLYWDNQLFMTQIGLAQ